MSASQLASVRSLACTLAIASLVFAAESQSQDKPSGTDRPRIRVSLDSELPTVDDIAWPVELGVQQTSGLEASFGCRGTFGTGFFTGQVDNGWPPASFDSPPGSGVRYLWGAALWIGGVVAGDTLVSVGTDATGIGGELHPPGGGEDGSITAMDTPGDFGMRAEFTDTLVVGVAPDWTGRPHIPLNIRVANRSHVWREEPHGSFVLYDIVVTNIGDQPIAGGYFGMYCDPDIHRLEDRYGYRDDLSGSIRSEGIFYGIDNDGDPVDGTYEDSVSTPRIFALKYLQTSFLAMDTCFNWWSTPDGGEDFGPRYLGTDEEPYRDFGTGGSGIPLGDGNKYHVMSSAEWDYDQCYTWSQFLQPLDTVWLKPEQSVINDLTDGTDTRFLASIGPFDLAPDSSVRVLLTTFTADSVHNDVLNFYESLPEWPYAYLARLGQEKLLPVAEAASTRGMSLLDPKLPPSGLQVIQTWRDSALIEWDPWVFKGVDGMELKLAPVDQSLFPHEGVIPPWLHPQSASHTFTIQHPWRFMVRGLHRGVIYSLKLAHWSGGSLGEFCSPMHLRLESQPEPPVWNEFSLMPAGQPVTLRWTAPEQGGLDHYHLYRFPDMEAAAGRYSALYDRGLMRREIAPVDSTEVADTLWYYYAMDVYREIDGQATECEVEAVDGEVFVLATVDDRGFESELSAVTTVTEVAGGRRDVLVVTRSNPIADAFTPYDSIVDFYREVLSGYDYDIFSVSDSCPLEQYQCPGIRELGCYDLIIVDDGMFDLIPDKNHESLAGEYRKYLEAGGRLAYFGAFSSFLQHQSNTLPGARPLVDGFVNEFFGIDSVWYAGYGYFVLNRLPVLDDLFGFHVAEPTGGGYPRLHCDTSRYPMGRLWSTFWPSSSPPTVAAFSVNANGSVTHEYRSTLASASVFEGLPVGVKTVGNGWETNLYGFHLYYMQQSGATELVGRLVGRTPTSLETPGVTGLPDEFELHQNYPNPFNPDTRIEYDLPERAQIRLSIYNVLGQEVRTLCDGFKPAGSHSAEWDGKDAAGRLLASGIYLYRLQVGQHSQTRKMILLK